ncbi:MAG: chorismate synthase, partial [Paracoccaceae bacterium]|nr:chorismate synthase [Paracoccaceae bacterium]
ETAIRVAAGAIARKVLGKSLKIRGAMIQLGPLDIDPDRWSWPQVNKNPFFCPDARSVPLWTEFLDGVRKSGSSAGAVIEIQATGMPVGLGAPVFDRLDADIAKAIMSIPAVKGIEIGAGFGAADLSGEENADEMRMKGRKKTFLSNSAGGVLGGISTGQDLIVRFAVKPTSSIRSLRQTINTKGKNATISTKGRHDPCVGIRAVPIGEAMVACVLADHLLRHKAQCE